MALLLLEGQPGAVFTFNTVGLAPEGSLIAAETVVRSVLEIGAHHLAAVEKLYYLITDSIQEIVAAHQRQSQPRPTAFCTPVRWMPGLPLTNCVLAGKSLETHVVVAGMLGHVGCYVSFPRSHIPAQADPVRSHMLDTEGVARSRQGRCAKCDGGGRLIKCPRCKQVKYCSRDCRRADKPAHERLCSIAQRLRL